MENFFTYYKGYKKDNNKKIINPIFVLAVFVLMALTIIFGFIGIIFSLSQGESFSNIFEIAPVVVILTIFCLILIIPTLIFYLYLRKQKLEKKNWRNVRVYLDDGEELEILVKKDIDSILIKTWKIYKILNDEIINIEAMDKVRFSFKEDKKYYILFNLDDFNMLDIHF